MCVSFIFVRLIIVSPDEVGKPCVGVCLLFLICCLNRSVSPDVWLELLIFFFVWLLSIVHEVAHLLKRKI